MLKSKTIGAMLVLCLLAKGAYAQNAENTPSQSPFNYVTIDRMLEIDTMKALASENEEAEKLGLIKPTSRATVEGLLHVNTNEQSADSKAEATVAASEAPVVEQEDELSPAEKVGLLNPRLINIYGTGNRLSATMHYGGYTYRFLSGSKKNQQPNEGNPLSLISIAGQCVNVYDEIHKIKINACIGGGR